MIKKLFFFLFFDLLYHKKFIDIKLSKLNKDPPRNLSLFCIGKYLFLPSVRNTNHKNNFIKGVAVIKLFIFQILLFEK